MLFVGVDLTSAFARKSREIDIAVLDDRLNCQFKRASWPQAAMVTGRDPRILRHMVLKVIPNEPAQVWALDGPQGLAPIGHTMRHCERLLGTPGRTPDTLPPAVSGGRPFSDYIRSSVDLFAALLANSTSYSLAGVGAASLSTANLYEVFPGAEWSALAGQRLPRKRSERGRLARRSLMGQLGVQGLPPKPTADQNDAVVGAYLAWCTRHEPEAVVLCGLPPTHAQGEIREGYILHAATTRRAVAVPDIAPAEPASPSWADAVGDSVPDDDWASGEDLSLRLTDYGIVHGTCPENSWMEAGANYTCVTIAPDVPETFELIHAPTFPGGRGWKSNPMVKVLLGRLGHSTPSHLGKENAVVLRIRLV